MENEDIQEPTEEQSQAAEVPAVEQEQPQEQQAEPADPRAGTKALLDTLSEPDPNAPKEGPVEKPDEAKPEPKAEQPQTPEQEEASLLEGVKSERGKERIKAMLAERKQAQSELSEFREMVISTGMSPDQFAQSLEFGRLVNSGKDEDKRTALAMLDAARADLVKELGIEAPGVDPLADYPDLSKSVEGMEVTRERALEIAKYRRREEIRNREEQARQQSTLTAMEFQQQLDKAAKTADAYFATRAKEADHPARMRQIHAYFADPARVQEFVSTFPPETWFSQFKFMYDNIRVAPAARQPQPISSRPTASGAAKLNPNMSSTDRMMSILDNMGI